MSKKRYGDGPLASASSAIAVTPNDVTEVVDDNGATYPRALFIGGAGNLSVVMADQDTPVVFNGLQAGQTLDIQVKIVRATGTSATGIVALF